MTSVLPGTENPSTGGWSRRRWFTLRGWCPTSSVEVGFPWFPITTIGPLKMKNRLVDFFDTWQDHFLWTPIDVQNSKFLYGIKVVCSSHFNSCDVVLLILRHLVCSIFRRRAGILRPKLTFSVPPNESKWYYLESDNFKQPTTCWCILQFFFVDTEHTYNDFVGLQIYYAIYCICINWLIFFDCLSTAQWGGSRFPGCDFSLQRAWSL